MISCFHREVLLCFLIYSEGLASKITLCGMEHEPPPLDLLSIRGIREVLLVDRRRELGCSSILVHFPLLCLKYPGAP